MLYGRTIGELKNKIVVEIKKKHPGNAESLYLIGESEYHSDDLKIELTDNLLDAQLSFTVNVI
jgi:hypothetical protein